MYVRTYTYVHMYIYTYVYIYIYLYEHRLNSDKEGLDTPRSKGSNGSSRVSSVARPGGLKYLDLGFNKMVRGCVFLYVYRFIDMFMYAYLYIDMFVCAYMYKDMFVCVYIYVDRPGGL
jgi:hypothetical protein